MIHLTAMFVLFLLFVKYSAVYSNNL